jgi:hypothetical protein
MRSTAITTLLAIMALSTAQGFICVESAPTDSTLTITSTTTLIYTIPTIPASTPTGMPLATASIPTMSAAIAAIPQATPAPSETAAPAQMKYHLTTYTTCVTWPGGYVHCGTHTPVLEGGDEISGAGAVVVDAGLVVLAAVLAAWAMI